MPALLQIIYWDLVTKFVKIHNIEGFDSISYVLPDGKINLVRIDPLLIKGKTLTQAKSLKSETNILKNWPRVSDAIEIAGVKDNGDLSSIKLTRFNSNDNNRETINIDLSKVITSGSSDSNINILNNDKFMFPFRKLVKIQMIIDLIRIPRLVHYKSMY